MEEQRQFSDSELKKELKKHRRILRRQTWTIRFGFSLFLIAAVIFLHGFFNQFNGYDIIAVVILNALGMIILWFQADRRNDEVKVANELISHAMIPGIMKEKFTISAYHPDQFVNRRYYTGDGIRLGSFYRVEGSDFTEGSYRGFDFLFSDLRLIDRKTETDSDGHSHTVDDITFSGQFICFDSKKPLAATVNVWERSKPKKKKGFFDAFDYAAREEIETDNELFNQKWRVTSSNAHEAFYVLTPERMELIHALDEIADGKTRIQFRSDGMIYLGLNRYRHLFEVKPKEVIHLDLDRLRERFQAEVEYLSQIFDVLIQMQ